MITVPTGSVKRLSGAPLSVAILLTTALATGSVLTLARPDNLTLLLCDLAIVTLLAINFTAIYSLRTYFFSSSFWTALFFAFYFVLKSTEYFGEEEDPWVIAALLHCSVFLVFFNAGYLLTSHGKPPIPSREPFLLRDGRRLAQACTAIFIIAKLLNTVATSLVVGSDYNQIALSESTQNQGMAYLFRAFTIGQFALLMLMAYYFIHRRHLGYVLVCVCLYIVDATGSASRGGLIIFILSTLYLCDKYVRRISPLWLLALSPFLIFIVSFFGYVRSIEIGSASVYVEAFQVFLDDTGIVWRLFIGRLDLLPTIAGALLAHAKGELAQLWGSSYLGILMHFIPRNVWPAKPPLTAAYVTAVVQPGPFEAGVLIYPTMALEGFLNFGLAGIALSASFTGFLSCHYDRWMRGRGLGQTFLFLAFFTFPMGLIAEGVHSNFVAVSLYSAALLWVLVRILYGVGALRRAPDRRPVGRKPAMPSQQPMPATDLPPPRTAP